MVQKHFADKTAEATRALKAEEAERRRIASFIAREVRNFWGNIERLYDYKVRALRRIYRVFHLLRPGVGLIGFGCSTAMPRWADAHLILQNSHLSK